MRHPVGSNCSFKTMRGDSCGCFAKLYVAPAIRRKVKVGDLLDLCRHTCLFTCWARSWLMQEASHVQWPEGERAAMAS